MKKTLKFIKKSMYTFALLALVLGFPGMTSIAHAVVPPPNWNTSGSYVIDMQYNNSSYPHDMVLVQDNLGNLTGHGGSPAGSNVYTWVITSGLVSGNSINVTANYTATPDAVTPQTTLNLTGTIAPDGTMSGTWSDNYQDDERAGPWATTSGTAVAIPDVTTNVTTNPATAITTTDAMLNGTNGNSVATGHSFWVSLAPFVTTSPTIPAGVYSTPDMGALAANLPFSASLSSVTTTGVPTNLPAITPNTTYYFAAWSNVGGTWYPGAVLNFNTTLEENGTEGTISGIVNSEPSVLHVDSITSSENNANGISDNTFAHGWSYTFHITAPVNEPNLSMKFANWLSGANVLPVANNMQISSAQASNGPIVLTAANTYSSPLIMTGDLDAGTAGRQVDVVVQVKIPVGTANGSYNTSYGVQTN